MALSDEDVREILRIVDESELDELLVETDAFRLHVRKGTAGADETSLPPHVPSGESGVRSPAPDAPARDGRLTIAAPMLGTFYRAEGPGGPPFVDVGSEVAPDTIVGIIEVMKMMNSIPAGVSGRIVEVRAENAELVEYGAALFAVEPA